MAGLSIGNRFTPFPGLSAGGGMSRGSGLSFGGFTPTPALSLTFAGATTLDPRITFSRPSLATLYDSTGLLTYAPNNLLLQSDGFGTASWIKAGCSFSASLLTASAGAGRHTFRQFISSVSNGQNFIATVDVAYVNYNYITISMYDGGSAWTTAVFDLSSPVAATQTSTQLNTLTASSITPISGGRYRIAISGRWLGGSGSANLSIGLAGAATGNNLTVDGGIANFTAAGTEQVSFYNATSSIVTYETSPRAQDQVITTSSAYYGPRFDYNPSTLAARGLLIEEARTNTCLYSQDIANAAWAAFSTGAAKVGVASAAAPDGTSTAYEISVGTNGGAFNGASAIFTGVNVVAGTNYAASVWVRAKTGSTSIRVGMQIGASYDSGDITVGTSWQRIIVTSSAPAPGSGPGNISIRTNVAGTSANVFIWGAQFEVGTFATSYIPTGASSVARSADSVIITGTNFSSWYNQSQGTFVTNFSRATTVANNWAYALSVPSGFSDLVTGPTSVNFRYGASSADLSVSATFSSGKIATAYTANGTHALAINGGAVSTSSITPDPGTPTFIRFGAEQGAGVGFLNGWIASINYYNSRLSDLTLQSLST
jgi:hypothetical protein